MVLLAPDLRPNPQIQTMRPTISSTALTNGLVRHATAMLGRLCFSENTFLALIAVGVGIVAGLAHHFLCHPH